MFSDVTANQKIDLRLICTLQEAAANEHFQRSPVLKEMVRAISAGLGIVYKMMSEMHFGAEKQTALRHFAGDTLSHIVVAVRVGLWGAVPEGLAVLRGALESGAQLEYIVSAQLYKTAIQEAKAKFVRVSFETARKNLGELGRAADKLHGRISDLASHSTSRRYALLDYNLDGEEYDRFGFSVQPELAEHIAYISLWFLMQLACSLHTAYAQDNHGLTASQEQEIVGWKYEFDRVCEKFTRRASDT